MGATFARDDRGGVVIDARRSAPVPRDDRIAPTARFWASREQSTGHGFATRSADCSATGRHSPRPRWWSIPRARSAIILSARPSRSRSRLRTRRRLSRAPTTIERGPPRRSWEGIPRPVLFTEVREKRGLCYSVYAAYEGQLDRAAMLCYAGTSTDRAQQTLDVMLDEIERLGKSGVALDELETMRAGLKSSLIMAQESSMSRSGSLASDWFFLGRVRPIEEIAIELDALSPDAVSDYAATFGKNGKPTILDPGAHGPASSPLSSGSMRFGHCRRHALEFCILSPTCLSGTLNIMQFEHTTLDNGLEIIAELNDRALSVAAGFIVRAGSRDESAEVAGVSHFLEHMTFKGTKRRDAVAVNRDFDRVGAKHNAQTSEEDTFYHVTCLPEYLPQAFDVLSDILRPTLRAADFETEKKVIIEEIRMYLDNPMSVAYEAAKTAHFGTHPLGNSILGTVESITSLEASQMQDYFARRYSPSNIVLAFAGNAEWSELVELARTHCGRWEGGVATRDAKPYRGSASFRAILRADDQQQTVVAVCSGPPLESPDRYAAHLLATILGDHTGSRLYWTSDRSGPG